MQVANVIDSLFRLWFHGCNNSLSLIQNSFKSLTSPLPFFFNMAPNIPFIMNFKARSQNCESDD